MAEYLRINPDNPDMNAISHVAEALKKGAVIIYPTDTVYGLGCDITHPKAIEKVARIKGSKAKQANLSIVCHNLSHLSSYVRPISNTIFRGLKRNLPGPFTFILPANNAVPKVFNTKKKEVGIRVPDNLIPRKIVEVLGNPIVTTSVVDLDELIEHTPDPQVIYERFKDQVDIVIDGGYGNTMASTVILAEDDDFVILRAGLGEFKE